jgi:hypothetical protein
MLNTDGGFTYCFWKLEKKGINIMAAIYQVANKHTSNVSFLPDDLNLKNKFYRQYVFLT